MKRRNLKEYITGFHELCKSTGRYQLDNQNKAIVDMKSDETPVTDVDIHSSELIVNFIKRKFPQDVIISEENKEENNAYNSYWLVDPIDGTKNYISGGGQFCICIALIEENYPVFGIIYVPSKKQFYYAIKNEGCYLMEDDKSLQALKIKNTPLQNILLSSSIRKSVINVISNHLPSHRIIQLSSAIKFAMIASSNGVFSVRLGPTYEWDTAAGQCIVEEAGGQFLNKNLERFSYGSNNSYLNGPFFVIHNKSKYYENIITDCLSLIS